jgi:DNA-binding IclR family transcriptional regulator
VPLGTSEVARRLRLAKSTVHGLLRSLEAVGAVEEVHRCYRLGPAVERLAATGDLRRRWRPVLHRLALETGETAFLGQARGSRVAIVDEVLGQGVPVISVAAGSSLPATAGAVGRVLAGERVAVDRGEYLEGVNAVAAAVPGGLVWVAGFAARLTPDRLDEVAALLGRLCA